MRLALCNLLSLLLGACEPNQSVKVHRVDFGSKAWIAGTQFRNSFEDLDSRVVEIGDLKTQGSLSSPYSVWESVFHLHR